MTYEQIMQAAKYVVEHYASAKHPGDVDEFDMYDFWSAWAAETGHEFEDVGTACCPEVQYPEANLFAK